MRWEIVHVPGKLPSSLEDSTVDVIACVIEPSVASKLVRELNQICPLENLRHVKRVRKRTLEGNVQLSVILCLSQKCVNHADGIPDNVLHFVTSHQLIPFNTKVARYAASSKEEWEEQCKLWPTSYHPPNKYKHRCFNLWARADASTNVSICGLNFLPKHGIFRDRSGTTFLMEIEADTTLSGLLLTESNNNDGTFGFCEEDSKSILKYIKDAILLAKPKYVGDKVVNAAVIVDPMSKQIIASGSDQTCPRSMLTTEKSSKCNPHAEQTVTNASPKSRTNGLAKYIEDPIPNFSRDECYQSFTAVSCLYPWIWSKQCLLSQNSHECRSNSSWHPLRHAALVAIENAAARDMQLFPELGTSGGQPIQKEILQPPSNGAPAKRQRIQTLDSEENLFKETNSDDLPSESMRPYLCTGFDIYIVWEPCTMCAMALVHQRIRRIFYAFPNPNAGALGSVHRLHGEKSLNHHYSVFRVMLPEKVLHDVDLYCSDDSLVRS